MQIQILKIALQNFKGIRSLSMEFGTTTNIYGTNEAGKTTIFDAFLWLMFGKDSMNSATFDIKTLDANGSPIHNLEHSVEAFLMADGQTVSLKKVFQEKYTRRRGSAASEFTGHTTDYWFNGVPVKEKEYQERIKGLVNESVFRLVTDPRYFNEAMHWAERRKILMEICGDVSAQDVIASDSGLAGLESILDGHGIEDAKKIIASKRKEINDELAKIPVRIDEAARSKAEIIADISEVPGRIKSLQGEKEELERQLADLHNGGALSRKRIELQNVEAEILRARNAWGEDQRILIAPLQDEIETLHEKIRECSRKAGNLESDLSAHRENKAAYERELVTLRDEWTRIDGQEISISDTCPTCNRALPEIQVNEAREKANKARAEKLSGINARGKDRKAKADEFGAFILQTTNEIENLRAESRALEGQEGTIKAKIDGIKAQTPDLSEIEQRKSAIQAEIDNIQASAQGMINEVQDKINEIKDRIMGLQAELQRVENNKAAEKRVAELQAQEKKLAGEFEKLESDLFKVENFIRAKVALLEARINGAFRLVRFKLFEDQINGGLTETCITTLNGVPYPSINNAGRIQAGMDIIKALQGHYGITAPVWIDNRESIVDLPEMPGQTISLIVSEKDGKLRIESENNKMKKAGGM